MALVLLHFDGNTIYYSSRNTFSAIQELEKGFRYCEAATPISELKTIKVEGYYYVLIYLLKPTGQSEKN